MDAYTSTSVRKNLELLHEYGSIAFLKLVVHYIMRTYISTIFSPLPYCACIQPLLANMVTNDD